MNIKETLHQFEEVTLAEEASLDTSFADEFMKTFTRMAKGQMKTQQSVALAADDVKQHLARQEDLISDIKQQREAFRVKNEQLVRFLLDVSDLIANFHKSTRDSPDETLAPVADTMYRALRIQMKKAGISRIPALGEIPDALYHFVLNTAPAVTHAERDRIVEVVREGYLLDGVVIRKSDVIVGK
jgi:molecular chaperone GrpE